MSNAIALPNLDPGVTTNAEICALGFLGSQQRKATRDGYKTDIRFFFNWCTAVGIKDPLTATRAHVQAYVAYLSGPKESGGRGLAPITVARRITGGVHGFFDYALEENYIPYSPCQRIKLPKVHRDISALSWLDAFEMGVLRRTARNSSPLDWCIFELLGTLGLRIGAAIAIDVEDVFLPPGSGLHEVRITTKGGVRATKAIPLTAWPAFKAVIGGRTTGPLLRRTRAGARERSDRESVGRRLRNLAAAAGLEQNVTPHTLRRSLVTNLILAGVHLDDIARQVDHAKTSTTQLYNMLAQPPEDQVSHIAARIWSATSR